MEPTSSATATAASTSGSALALGAGSTYNNDHPIPSTASTSTSRNSAAAGDLWADILKSTNRQKGYGRKNLLVLSERHHGRRYLLDQLARGPSSSSSSSSSKGAIGGSGKRNATSTKRSGKSSLVVGYQVIEIRDDMDEDSIPPLSVFYPPSSDHSFVRLIPKTLPPKSLSDTAVVIVLDWTKPSSMVKELLNWMVWIDGWASSSGERGETEEMRERLQSHLQHYTEPAAPSAPALSSTSPLTTPALPTISSVAYGQLGGVLPLGSGALTLNKHGVPITVVCTKADLMDSVGDELGMKGAGWEERTDWIQQVLRTVCLSYGAALFYTAISQPQTYTLLRQYILHRFYTNPPPLNPSPTESSIPTSTRFPFQHRANVLDRDAVMVPAGWDSWGKLTVLRDGFDPARVGRSWEVSLSRSNGEDGGEQGEEEGIEDLWLVMIPDTEKGPKLPNHNLIATTAETEQSFLARQLDILIKDPNRDPRASFRQAAAVTASSQSQSQSLLHTQDPSSSSENRYAGVVGPMGTGGLNLPGVEKAMAEMEGGSAEDMKERFARIARRESSKGGNLPLASPGGLTSPTSSVTSPGTTAVPNEALHNFFQGLLATRTKTVPSSAGSAPGTPVAPNSSAAASSLSLMPPPPVPPVKKSVE